MLFMPFMKPSPVITYVGSDALRKGRIPCVTRGALFCSAVKRRLSQFSLFTLSLSLSLSFLMSWNSGIAYLTLSHGSNVSRHKKRKHVYLLKPSMRGNRRLLQLSRIARFARFTLFAAEVLYSLRT